MVAGGIPNHADDHAIQVVKMALGMYEDLETFNAEHSMERMRSINPILVD
jgi:hypothetical protein